MGKIERIEDFYKSKFDQIPDNLKKEIGHFNIFRLENLAGKHGDFVPYNRKDYYKITLVIGKIKINYADKTIEIKKQCLLFSNPQIPYNWELLAGNHAGYICVFTSAFFHHFGHLNDYAVFQPNGTPVFELTDEQTAHLKESFERMFVELTSDYEHKNDVLRNLVFEILHSGMKMHPASSIKSRDMHAAHRISILFLELLERQFPIEDTRKSLQLRSASDYAHQLSIHVNHLNKALKETTSKTTSAIIADRVVQEAKALLKNSHWNISEIAYTLGFNEVSHFNNFFKKKLNISPSQFKKD